MANIDPNHSATKLSSKTSSKATPTDMTVQRLGMRLLAELTHATGGLARQTYGGVTAIEGIKLHQKAAEILNLANNATTLHCEPTLKATYIAKPFQLDLTGKADYIIESDTTTIIEIKSFRGDVTALPKNGESTHLAQLKLYAYAWQQTYQNFAPISLRLIYLNVDDPTIQKEHNSVVTAAELADFFSKTCTRYLNSVSNYLSWLQLRNQACLKAKFPYKDMRSGQKKMMQAVLHAIKTKRTAMIEAPTGIGKTIATLYPAAKALSAGYTERILYLTAMTSTRRIAELALDDMNLAGFVLRSLTLATKEQLCHYPDLFCDQNLCPGAVEYYKRLPQALAELTAYVRIDAKVVSEVAHRYCLCPFELQLDAALYSDVIIGDYNHLLDPKASIKRLVTQESGSIAVLLDEAHNLPGRTRAMISASIDISQISQAIAILKDPLHGRRDLADQAVLTLQQLGGAIMSLETSVNDPEAENAPDLSAFFAKTQNCTIFKDYNFQSSRFIPDKLLGLVNDATNNVKLFLDAQFTFPERRKLLEVWFKLSAWQQVAMEFYGETHVTILRKNKQKHLELELFCLDASTYLLRYQNGIFPMIMFSATLTPLSYFKTLISGQSGSKKIDSLVLKSPFDTSRRLQLALTHLSLRYKDRGQTLAEVAKAICQITATKTGNYLIFSPSFAYQSQLESYLMRSMRPQNTEFMFQRQNLTIAEKNQFLTRFDSHSETTLLAFCVMRSLFNEGIDLKGDKLIGVFVLGTGMPTISPERTLLEAYYGEKTDNGYNYAYTFPGFNQVYQAAGRLIRDENDHGIVILIDDRYSNEHLTELYPQDWNVRQVNNTASAVRLCSDFFSDYV